MTLAHFAWSAWSARFALVACVTLASGLARARETSQERLERTTRALDGRDSVAVALAIWEAVELAPLALGGPEALLPRLERLAARSRLPWVRGEALIARARLAGASNPDAMRPLMRQAGVLGTGALLGPLPGSDVPATPPRADEAGWRGFANADLGGAIPIGDFLPAVGDLHVWVAFDVVAERDTRATLVLGTSGNMAVWVDEARVDAWQGERPLTDWQSAHRLAIPRGRHRIVIGSVMPIRPRTCGRVSSMTTGGRRRMSRSFVHQVIVPRALPRRPRRPRNGPANRASRLRSPPERRPWARSPRRTTNSPVDSASTSWASRRQRGPPRRPWSAQAGA